MPRHSPAKTSHAVILDGSTISSIGHARQMAAHLFKDENEVIRVRELGGSKDKQEVEKSLVDMYKLTDMIKGNKNAIFHVAVSPRGHERLNEEQTERAVEAIEQRFDLVGQYRFQVDHVKEGKLHTHVFWSAVDLDKQKLKPLNHYYRNLQTVSTALEKEFGHDQTPRRKSDKSYEITNGDRMRQNRTKEKALTRKEEVTALWHQSDSAKAFMAALGDKGYALAKGDRSKFALIDRHGNVSNLVRDLPKTIKTKDVMERFGEGYDRLKNVNEAKEHMATRSNDKVLEQRQGQNMPLENQFNSMAKESTEKKDLPREKKKKAYDGLSTDEAVQRGLAHFLERKSSVGVYQLSHYVSSNSSHARSEVQEALKKQKNVITAMRDDKLYVTTHEAVQDEEQMIAYAKQGKNTQAPLNEAYTPKQTFLNEGQKNAIGHVLNSKDQVMIISGGAGVGKTSLMKEVKEGIEERGKTLHAFAPSANASRGVLREKGFEGANTIASLLRSKKVQEQTRNGVILIDEAGMVGNKTMNRIFEVAQDNNARVILSGDYRQHNSPEAGDALRILEDKSGLEIGRVSKVVRQKDETYRKAVDHLAKGESEKGFDTLHNMSAIKEIYDDEARYDQVATDYLASRKAGRSTLVVSPTHAEGREASAVIRDKLKEQGMIGKEDRQFITQRNLSLTTEQKRLTKSYGKDMSVRFHDQVSGFEMGSSYDVTGRTKSGKIVVRDHEGKKSALPLYEAGKFQVFQKEDMSFTEGDRLKITANGQTVEEQPLNNGEVHTIKGFDNKGNIQLGNGQTIPKDYRNIALGYYDTSHASQGKDAQDVFVVQGSKSFMASNSKQFYVSVSRGEDSVRIYTDDAGGLRQVVDKSGDRMIALEIAEKSPQFIFNRKGKHQRKKGTVNDLQTTSGQNAENIQAPIESSQTGEFNEKAGRLEQVKKKLRQQSKKIKPPNQGLHFKR